MAISTNQKPTIYRNLYENTGQTRIHTAPKDVSVGPYFYFLVLFGIQNDKLAYFGELEKPSLQIGYLD